MNFYIRPFDKAIDTWFSHMMRDLWGSTRMVSCGRLFEANQESGFVAVISEHKAGGQIAGVALYRLEDQQCELSLLNSLVKGRGVGTALVEAVRQCACQAGCTRLWLVTTNDNLPAIRFYQKCGFTLAAVHKNALALSRKLKPEIPETGLDGLPLRDEIEFEMFLSSNRPKLAPNPEFPRRLGRHTLYSSNFVRLHLDTIQLTTGKIIDDFHVVESPKDAVAALVENPAGELLFEEVYRYPTGRLEWEIPAGGIDPGEAVVDAARREVFEETGYQTLDHRLLYHYYPANGNNTVRFFVVHCQVGERTGHDDPAEIRASHWLTRPQIEHMLSTNQIQDGLTLTALLLLSRHQV